MICCCYPSLIVWELLSREALLHPIHGLIALGGAPTPRRLETSQLHCNYCKHKSKPSSNWYWFAWDKFVNELLTSKTHVTRNQPQKLGAILNGALISSQCLQENESYRINKQISSALERHALALLIVANCQAHSHQIHLCWQPSNVYLQGLIHLAKHPQDGRNPLQVFASDLPG